MKTVVDKKLYKSGQTPERGDIVKIDKNAYSTYCKYAVDYDAEYQVSEVIAMSVGTLIKLAIMPHVKYKHHDIQGRTYSASNWHLARRAGNYVQKPEAAPKPYAIICDQTLKVAYAENMLEIVKIIDAQVMQNPSLTFKVYELKTITSSKVTTDYMTAKDYVKPSDPETFRKS